jgi:hypothetical protein
MTAPTVAVMMEIAYIGAAEINRGGKVSFYVAGRVMLLVRGSALYLMFNMFGGCDCRSPCTVTPALVAPAWQ